MIDNYAHESYDIMYIVDNIPGPLKNDSESKCILNNFNSNLYLHCNCVDNCAEGKCPCLIRSGGGNYLKNSNSSKYILNSNKLQNGSYPIFECNSYCSCHIDCGNRIVQNGPITDLSLKKCYGNKGKGLFINKCIPKGTFICIYAGEIITKSEAMIRHKSNYLSKSMNYIFCLKEHSNGCVTETIVDPSKFGNIGRYINHSCEANCVIVPVRIDTPVPKLAVFSKTDIAAGKELSFDYGPHSISSNETNLDNKDRTKCLCDSLHCRQWLPFEIY